jgi:hypothetical protein
MLVSSCIEHQTCVVADGTAVLKGEKIDPRLAEFG